MGTTLLIIGGVAVLIIIFLIATYNSLVARRNQIENVFGSIDALLKKRYDLIPNLVSACKEYMKHEEGLLTKVTELRTKALSGNMSNEERVGLDNELTKALDSIRVAVENYPDLKANQNFIQLQKALNEVEEQISAARRAYNAAVTDYNNAIEMFPSSIMAGIMRLKRKKVFEIPEVEREAPDVKKLFNE